MSDHYALIQDLADEYRQMHPIVEKYEGGVLVRVERANLHDEGFCNCRIIQNNGR